MDTNKIDEKAKNILGNILNKIGDKLGITNGQGLIAIGCFWFIYCILSYVFTSPESAIQQIVHENLFNQAVMSVIIVGIGAILKKMK